MSEAKYKRILLKLSGEALAGEQKTGEIINICEDFNGIYKPNILENRIEKEVKNYNLMEINKNNFSIC